MWETEAMIWANLDIKTIYIKISNILVSRYINWTTILLYLILNNVVFARIFMMLDCLCYNRKLLKTEYKVTHISYNIIYNCKEKTV